MNALVSLYAPEEPTTDKAREYWKRNLDLLMQVTETDYFVTFEPEEVVRGQWKHFLPEIPPGDSYLHFTAERGHPDPVFKWRSRYWSFLLKLDPGRPSPTIQAQPGPNVGSFHWENRRLRVPELKRPFTFPDDFQFVGRRASVGARASSRSSMVVKRMETSA